MEAYYIRKHDNITTRIWMWNGTAVRIHKSFDGREPRKLPILLEDTLRQWKNGSPRSDTDERSIPMPCENVSDASPAEKLEQGMLEVRIGSDGAVSCFHRRYSAAFREVEGRHVVRQGANLLHSFRLEGCHFYGFGEKTGPLEKTGTRMRFSGKDACGYDPEKTDPLYKHVPFFLKLPADGIGCTGVFYHTAADCEIDIGREVNGYYPPMGQFITQEKEVDVFLFFGQGMALVLDQFTALTGRPALLPKYALGYLGSTMYYTELPQNADREILAFVGRGIELGLPCSNFQLSSGYTTDETGRRNVFHWNKRKFPDPGAFVAQMAAAGVTVTPNVKPAMLTTNPLYREFAQAGAFIRNADGSPYVTRFWGGQGSFVDFTNSIARELWKCHLKADLFAYGIQSIWNDNNEFDLLGGICDNDGSPTPATELRNALPLLMNRTGWEALTEYWPNRRPYQVSRSGCAGINRYAQVWTGDNRTGWDSLKWNIATMLCSSLSGMPLTGSDVGGFAGGAPDQELFLRWIACGVVMPRFTIHSANDDNTVTEPWMYPSAVDTVRGFFALRQRLMPYLYSLHHQAHRTGTAILRPMVWHYPADRRSQKENVDFTLGDGLLCACVVESGTEKRTIWLPGQLPYYDFYTRQRYEAGQEVTLDAPLDKLLLLQRSGTMVPTREQDGLTLWVCPGASCGFTYRDDDGFCAQPREDMTVECEFTLDAAGTELTCRHIHGHQEWTIALQCHAVPGAIYADDLLLRRYLDPRQLSAQGSGWYFDMEHRIAWIRAGVFTKLSISYDPMDLIKMNV